MDAILCNRLAYANRASARKRSLLRKKPPLLQRLYGFDTPFPAKNLRTKRIILASFAGHEGSIKRRYVPTGRRKLFLRFHWGYRVSEENHGNLRAAYYL